MREKKRSRRVLRRFGAFWSSAILLLGIVQCTNRVDLSTEVLAGGDLFTSYNFSKDAFGVPGKGLERNESRFFQSGNELFRTNWVEAPASVASLDGLGPIFNASSCGSCHFKDGRAAPQGVEGSHKFGLLWRISDGKRNPDGSAVPHPIYGTQIQDHSLPKVNPEGRVSISYDTIVGFYDDGTSYALLKPNYGLTDLAYGEIPDAYNLSPRIAPQIAGMGLLEHIPLETILANQDIDDKDGDGISGKANFVWNVLEDKKTLGRFGWKASQPTVRQQSASAFKGDMGLTSSLFPIDEYSEHQQSVNPEKPDGGYPEISDRQLDRITLYVQALSVPAKRNIDKPEYLAGRKLFYKIGCQSCHQPSYTTGSNAEIAALDQQKIFPYTDLLLHDMGEGLADSVPDFDATGSEWRTPPLWGIGLIKTVNKHTRLLHDGRARNIEEAVLWHGGEASKANSQFKALSKKDREALLFFIESL
ncbi:MAG: di-heme oxidoredictase family protein [Bacteroidota bacterium]